MKIALINENSQAAKNGIILAALKKVVEPMGHTVDNDSCTPRISRNIWEPVIQKSPGL